MRKNTYLSLVIFLTSFIYDYQNLASQKVTETYYSPITLEKGLQGCCSWHHGVCGCSGGRVFCCDGTLSPSYKC